MSTAGKSILALVGRAGALPLLVLVAGLWLALEGLGIARAGFNLIGFQQYWAYLAGQDTPKTRDFEGALNAIGTAEAVRPTHPDYPDDLAVVLLEHALRGEEPLPGGHDDVERGIAALERSLALAPARAGTWTRLALARYIQDGYTEEFAEALQMSYLLGLYEPPLLQSRLELSLYAWDQLPKDLREAAEDQIAHLWRSRGGQATIAELFVRSDHRARFTLMRGVPQDEKTLRYFFGQIRRFKKEREDAGLEVVPPEFYLPPDQAGGNRPAAEEGGAGAQPGGEGEGQAEDPETEQSVDAPVSSGLSAANASGAAVDAGSEDSAGEALTEPVSEETLTLISPVTSEDAPQSDDPAVQWDFPREDGEAASVAVPYGPRPNPAR